MNRRSLPGWAKAAIAAVVVGSVLFGTAGTLVWWQGWAVLIVYEALVLALTVLVLDTSPDLVAERATARQQARKWDRVLVPLMALMFPVAIVVAGLDRRLGWSHGVSDLECVVALVVGGAANLVTIWAMRTNRFFSSYVRIQDERGHAVVDTGPYARVRHPGYLGSLVYNVLLPSALGSRMALLPAIAFVVVTVIRTALEDATLLRELPGYEAYARRVTYRLLPPVW